MVRCIDCGFLARQSMANLSDASNLREIPLVWRNMGSDALGGSMEARCFEDLRDIPTLADELSKVLPREAGRPTYPLRLTLEEDIECASFIQYKQGFSPKEHRERFDRQLLLDREDQRDAEMRDREDRRDAEARERHKEQMDALESQHVRELATFGGAVVVATIVAAILEGAISRGWEPGWWPF
jgi:hypothetical protein